MNANPLPGRSADDFTLSVTASEIRWHESGAATAPASHDPRPSDEEGEIARRFARWKEIYGISDPLELFQLEQLVTEAVRIERCQSEERLRIGRISVRAATCWEEDRHTDVMALVRKLPRDPERYALELGLMPQGCAWMIEQWNGLGAALEREGGWNARQRSRALDLLGTPTIFRDGVTPIDPTPADGLSEGEHRAALVAREVDFLESLIDDSRADLDEGDRLRAELGTAVGHDRAIAALRRFEAGCSKRFNKLLKALAHRLEPQPAQESRPRPRTIAAIQPQSRAAIEAPRDLPSRGPDAPTPIKPTVAPQSRPHGNRRQRRKQEALARRSS